MLSKITQAPSRIGAMFDPKDLKQRSAESMLKSLHKIMLKSLRAEAKQYRTEFGDISFYQTPFEPSRDTVVFLHGFADSKYSFFHAALLLSRQYNLVVPDLPGFGESFRNPNASYTPDHYHRWVVDLLDHLGLDQVHLVGNSLGGALSMGTSLSYPERLKSLGIIDAGGIVLDQMPSFYTDLSNGTNIFKIETLDNYELFLQRVFHRVPFIPWPMKYSHFQLMKERSEWHYHLLLEFTSGIVEISDPMITEKSFNTQLQDISVPTLVLWGKQDTFFPYQTAYYAHQRIKNSRLKILDGVGHSPQIERPKAFVQNYTEFLKSL